MYLLRFGALFMLVLALAGCASSRESSYLQAQSIKPITVPSGLSAAKIKPYYPIASVKAQQVGDQQPSLLPPGSNFAALKKSKSNGGDT